MTTTVDTAQGINPNVLGNHSSPESTSQSFHGKRFKALRVIGDALSSLVMSIFYKVLSLACWIVRQKSAYHRYGDLASYHFNRILNKPFAYTIYGDKVVNFAMNSTGTPRVFKGKEVDEVEELKKIYGELFEKMRSIASSDDFPILEKRLSQYPINQGICLGASLDFISRYLKDDSETTFEAIEKISKQFSEKGTPEAQITQILYRAQDIEQLLQKKSTHREKLKNELHENTEKVKKKMDERQAEMMEQMKKLKGSALKEFISKELPKIQLEVQNEMEKIQSDILRKIAENNSALDCERLQSLAQVNDLQLQLNTVFVDEDTKQKAAPELFNTGISQLSEGAYLVCLSNSPAIAFIKTSENETYLFDPNLATLKFEKPEEFVSELWSLTKNFYNTKGTCTMQVYNCNLKS